MSAQKTTDVWAGDNPDLLCQDCSTPLFRWFLSRIDWKRNLKEMTYERRLHTAHLH